MRVVRNVITLAMCAASTACVGAVNSFVTDDAALVAPELIGTWTDSAKKERAVITQAGPRRYGIDYTDDTGERKILEGRLGRSGAHFVLDVQPAETELTSYKDLIVRLHIPVILDTVGPVVRIAVLDADSLDQYLRAHPQAVAHARTTDGVVLTADTADLATFLAAYLPRPGVIGEPTMWLRRAP